MNKVILIGRLTADPEVKNTTSGIAVCRFSLAVDRKYKNSEGERQADFINCRAWRSSAEFAAKHLEKGMKIAVTGSIETGSFINSEGKKQYTFEVTVNEFEFVTSKSKTELGGQPGREIPDDYYAQHLDDNTTLPFDL